MNKNGLIRKISRKYGMTLDDTAAWVDAVIDVMTESVAKEDLIIHGFGSFKHKRRAPKVGRNAMTGEPIEIPERTVLKFTPSGKLAESVRAKKEGIPDVETDEPED